MDYCTVCEVPIAAYELESEDIFYCIKCGGYYHLECGDAELRLCKICDIKLSDSLLDNFNYE